MRSPILYILALAGVANLALASTASQWALRSIYQVITDRFALSDGSTDGPCTPDRYCGGSWAGLIKQLDYIQGMGFTAVQISPVSKNLPQYTKYGDAFHGYWVQDLYTLNSHFGTGDDLKSLSTELHNRGMYLMVDVVVNNMAYALPNNGSMPLPIDYSILKPFDNKDYYHPYCNITDWSNSTNYQDCWLDPEVVALPDLATENETVIKMLNTWASELVANYSIDGLRIDGAKQIDNAFFKSFDPATGVWVMGEVYDGNAAELCPYQQFLPGLENYALYDPIIQAFTAGQMAGLSTAINQVQQGCKDTTTLATFTDNQDQTRFASYTQDMALAKNALAFIILADGIPKVYYGQEQHLQGNYSPYNRQEFWSTGYNTQAPLYNLTASLNTIRNHAIAIDSRYTSNHSSQIHLDGSTMATRKGVNGVQIVSVFSNQGTKGGKYTLSVGGGFAPGTAVTEVLGCTKTTADAHGNITVPMEAGAPRVYFPTAQMNGSGICGFPKNRAITNSSSNSTSTKHSEGEQLQARFSTLAFGLALFAIVALLG